MDFNDIEIGSKVKVSYRPLAQVYVVVAKKFPYVTLTYGLSGGKWSMHKYAHHNQIIKATGD